MREADGALNVDRPAPILDRLRGKLLYVNGVVCQRDVRLDVYEARSQAGESRRPIGERDLTEHPRLFHVAANVGGRDGRPARPHKSRHERAKQSEIDAVGADVASDRIAL